MFSFGDWRLLLWVGRLHGSLGINNCNFYYGWDLAKWLERLKANAKVATVLGSIPSILRHRWTLWGGRWSSVEQSTEKNAIKKRFFSTVNFSKFWSSQSWIRNWIRIHFDIKNYGSTGIFAFKPMWTENCFWCLCVNLSFSVISGRGHSSLRHPQEGNVLKYFFFVYRYFFGGLECFDHSFASFAHFLFLRAAVASRPLS